MQVTNTTLYITLDFALLNINNCANNKYSETEGTSMECVTIPLSTDLTHCCRKKMSVLTHHLSRINCSVKWPMKWRN